MLTGIISTHIIINNIITIVNDDVNICMPGEEDPRLHRGRLCAGRPHEKLNSDARFGIGLSALSALA